MQNAPEWTPTAVGNFPRRLFVYNCGFLIDRRIKRILTLCGYKLRFGKPSSDDIIGVWGKSPTAYRGEKIAFHTGASILRVEDAFLRSVQSGRSGTPPLGLLLDDQGIHFDPTQPSRLEQILKEHPLDDTDLLNRARAAINRIKRSHLSKYTAFDPSLPAPEPGYVLVVDQTAGDASVTASRGDRNRFLEMLFQAREDHPGKRILIKTHPETIAGHRRGHFRADDGDALTELYDFPVSPWHLLEGAVAVYTLSSQLGFEAILAGHKPRVFGHPFYAGWGLTDDEWPLARRQRTLTRAQLFAAAMIIAPVWFDPYHNRLCNLETALNTLEAETRAWREDHKGWAAYGMRLWKRRHLQQFFGSYKSVKFNPTPPTQTDRPIMAWGETPTENIANVTRVEDGFLRSKGLGAALTPPLSLVLDDLGIYFDPTRPSRLEDLISKAAQLPESETHRAESLIRKLAENALTKYNLTANPLTKINGDRILLVPGQVEDDASIRRGAQKIATNIALLQETRRLNPHAIILYKPHPDVEAGLRDGIVSDTAGLADHILLNTNAIDAINTADEVWTMTSTLGFEAMLRSKPVTCFGQPFYAGWGLTNDLGGPFLRRNARPDLARLVHACLIDYPRYRDPVTGRPCPVEVIVDRLCDNDIPLGPPSLRTLSKLQGIFASYAYLWRR